MRTKFIKTLLLVIFVIIGAAYFAKHKYAQILDTPITLAEEITITIPAGSTVGDIAEKLSQSDILRGNLNKYAFILYVKQQGLGSKLQAGTFVFHTGETIKEVVQTLQLAKVQQIWITIPEGLRADEICQIIGQSLDQVQEKQFQTSTCITLIKDKDFINDQDLPISDTDINTLEGFLFPSKYSFDINSTTEEILTRMIREFKKQTSEYSINYDDLIIASLVEREGVNDQDKKIISGIIRNRLDAGWLLQIDASLLYEYKDWSYTITEQDQKKDLPYNTYMRTGLPPTPICNPGLAAIQAALDPTNTDYYYYLHDKNQQPHYSKTYQEHIRNIYKFLY